ncbi:MAG: sigma-70 family RNA polymerase sigma factor [Actinomycetota bacterium]|nr:sigma-70 family RNA polymerase sigma factor [Actinomycetota bacterium]
MTNEADVRQAYEAHGGELYRFALRSTGDEGTSQDIVQETFLRAWRAADKYDPALAGLRVWLFAIARNVITDHHRAAGVRPHLPGLTEAVAIAGSVTDHAEHLVDEWVINQALHRIGAEHRHALTETYLRDRPYGEIAAETGIPVGTLRSRVFYGLKALRAALDEMGVTV